MGHKLSQEEYKKRVKDRVGDKYSVVGKYEGKNKPILMKCNIHNVEFFASADAFMRGSKDIRCSCPKCTEEKRSITAKNARVELECAYCKKKFLRLKNHLQNSRTGLYFCCREHKDLAQRLDSDKSFDIMRPNHYGTATIIDYRQKAFDTYEHKCAICDFDPKDEEYLLDVHHIDSDRENNDISNLIILCPLCHRKLTFKKYKLIDRKTMVKIDN